jgi:hypothetical protein
MAITEPFSRIGVKGRGQTAGHSMILIRFAIGLFALCLLGMGFSLAAHSQQPVTTPIVTVR